jgi:hypothetical protein
MGFDSAFTLCLPCLPLSRRQAIAGREGLAGGWLEKARKSAKRRVGKAWGVVIFLVGTAKFSRKTGENAPYDSFFKKPD